MSDMKIPNIKTYTCSDGFVTDNAQVAKSHEANIKSNKFICPFCQQELEIWHTNRVRMYACPDLTCKGYYMSATKDMWQELIRIRKALDVAKDTIRHADWFFDGDYNVGAKTMHNEIKYAIKAITALEQKDVK